MAVETGLERILIDPAPLAGRRWSLLANHAAVTRELDPARAGLARSVGPPVRLFAPEHGLEGTAQDMEAVGDAFDPLTGAQVVSLYGSDATSLRPDAGHLAGVDAVVVDLPDIGTRYYTFAASLDSMMAACEEASVEILVLDRPNPLGGVRREGGPVEPGFSSFVSQLPTPIRHGLSLGEISLLLQRERYPDLELTVIPCRGWRREALYDSTGLPWVPPSPNMPTLDTALIYPGMCLVEATSLSEGRGTTRPFHLFGAPWVDGSRLVEALRALDLPGAAFRATTFRPEFQKHAGVVCTGCELHITDRRTLEPLALGLHVLRTVHDLFPEHFGWRAEAYEFVSDTPALDLLTGSPRAREAIEEGQFFDPMFTDWAAEIERFEDTLDTILMYR